MKKEDVEILKLNGWEIECESPLEIRHTDGSFATMQAAQCVIEVCYSKQSFEDYLKFIDKKNLNK